MQTNLEKYESNNASLCVFLIYNTCLPTSIFEKYEFTEKLSKLRTFQKGQFPRLIEALIIIFLMATTKKSYNNTRKTQKHDLK